MRGLGITALIMIGLSLLLWLGAWVFSIFILPTAGYNNPVRYILQTFNFLSSLLEYIAIGLISIGLILSSKRVEK